ncbi:MAG: VWA-like domain-containing protein [Gammaproteobacteria bacterium]
MTATLTANGLRAYGTSRGTRAIQAMVEHAPATGGLALWMRHVDLDTDALLPAAIANDGSTVFYAPRFETLPLKEQIGLVAHQTLHVAFRHVQRRDQLASVLGDVDATLYNACADALVNSTLSHLEWLRLPATSIYLDQLMKRVFEDERTVEVLLLQWDVERLYRAVDDRTRTTRSESRQTSNNRSNADGKTESANASTTDGRSAVHSDGRATPQSSHDTAAQTHRRDRRGQELGGDGPLSAEVRSLASGTEPDLLASAEGERPEDVVETTREWAERLLRGHASDGDFSMLRTLSADSLRVRTPWSQVLRRSLARGLIREPALSWSRPSRSWLANRGRTRNGRRMPWEPGTVTSKSVPRLALIVDISGSIDDNLLTRFAGQLDAITRQLEAQIILIAGDDQVRYEEEHTPGNCGLRSLPNMDGGGGTDFEPLIKAATAYSPDYAIVLTDLQGAVGTSPGFPVLWAVPPDYAYVKSPFGRLLVLAD